MLLEREWGGGDLKFISFWSSTSRVLCHTKKTALNMDKALFEFELRKGGQVGGGEGEEIEGLDEVERKGFLNLELIRQKATLTRCKMPEV